MDDVATRARAIGNLDPTVKLSVNDRAAMASLAAFRLELAGLKTAGDNAGLQDLAARLKAVGTAADSPRVKMSALRVEMQAMKAGGQDAKVSIGGLAGALNGLMGVMGGGGAAGGAGGAGLLGALSAMGPVLGGIAIAGTAVIGTALVPLIASVGAAAVSVGAFAAFAIPEWNKISAAATRTGAAGARAMARLSGPERGIALQLKDLSTSFGDVAKAVRPYLLKDFAAGLKLVKDLMPAIQPLVIAVANAFGGLLTKVDQWVNSPSGKKFLHWLDTEGPRAITTFANFLWNLANGIGQVFHYLYDQGETFDRRFMTNMHDIASAFDHLRHSFATTGHNIAHGFDDTRRAIAISAHDIAHSFDDVRHAIAIAGHDIAASFDFVRHAVASWAHDIASTFDRVRHDIAHWADDVVTFFRQLPGRIVSALGNLGHLLWNAGLSIIHGLFDGMKSAWDTGVGWLKSLGGLIGSLKGPLDKDIVLLRPHGQAIMDGLLGGMQSRMPDLKTQMARTTAAITGGVRGGPGYGAAGSGAAPAAPVQIVLELHPGGSGLDQMYFSWLANGLRVRGGSAQIITRKPKF